MIRLFLIYLVLCGAIILAAPLWYHPSPCFAEMERQADYSKREQFYQACLAREAQRERDLLKQAVERGAARRLANRNRQAFWDSRKP